MQKVRQLKYGSFEGDNKLVSATLINRNTGEVIRYNVKRIPFSSDFYSCFNLFFTEIASHAWNNYDYRIVFDVINQCDSATEVSLPF